MSWGTGCRKGQAVALSNVPLWGDLSASLAGGVGTGPAGILGGLSGGSGDGGVGRSTPGSGGGSGTMLLAACTSRH